MNDDERMRMVRDSLGNACGRSICHERIAQLLADELRAAPLPSEIAALKLEVEKLRGYLDEARCHERAATDKAWRLEQRLKHDAAQLADMIREAVGPSGSLAVLKLRFEAFEERGR